MVIVAQPVNILKTELYTLKSEFYGMWIKLNLKSKKETIQCGCTTKFN